MTAALEPEKEHAPHAGNPPLAMPLPIFMPEPALPPPPAAAGTPAAVREPSETPWRWREAKQQMEVRDRRKQGELEDQ